MSITGHSDAKMWGNGNIQYLSNTVGGFPYYLTADDSNLVLFYPFLSTDVCGNKLRDYATGSVIYDASLGYTPTFGTSNSFATGRSYININSSSGKTPIWLPSVVYNKTYTCCFWCKTNNTNGYNNSSMVEFSQQGTGGSYGTYFRAMQNSGNNYYPDIGGFQYNETLINSAGNTMNGIFNSNDGNWHHYALIVNKGTGELVYIDGSYNCSVNQNGGFSYVTTGSSLYNINLNYFILGCASWDANTYINGSMGDFRMYSRELLPLEINNIYNYGTIKPTTGYTPPIVSSLAFISTSIFNYTGSNQSIVIPANANHMIVSCWGGGGASMGVSSTTKQPLLLNSVGGGGGFTQAIFQVTINNQSNYNVIVAGGGMCVPVKTPAFGGFGGGGGATTWSGISGGNTDWKMRSAGGRSAVQYNSNDIITAGGGGAGGSTWISGTGYTMNGGAGGGLIGGSADHPTINGTQLGGGTGGTQNSGGFGIDGNGIKYQGGNSGSINGPGGGGYYGGGAGCYAGNGSGGNYSYAGGGGSSYIDSSTVSTSLSFTNTILQANKSIPPNLSLLPSSIVSNTIGYGGGEQGTNGGNGLVVISFYT